MHIHEDSDEIFWVVKGEVNILIRKERVVIGENQMFSVPKGIEHIQVYEETWIVLLEPENMLNTGDVEIEFTVKNVE